MTLSLRGLHRDLPYWRQEKAWHSYSWEDGAFMNPEAPIDAVLDFERWRRSEDGKTYKTTGMTDDQYQELLATIGIG